MTLTTNILGISNLHNTGMLYLPRRILTLRQRDINQTLQKNNVERWETKANCGG